MLAKLPPPSKLKQFIDQVAIPAAIDAAATMERDLDRLATVARNRPFAALSLAAGGGCMLSALLRRRRSI